MATAITPNTQFQSGSYLTLAEYKNAPTAIDYDNLVVGGNAAAQDAELASVIARASSFIDVHLNQTLIARQIVEQQRTRITPQGNLILHTEYNPIIAISALNWGVTPSTMIAATDPSQCWLEPTQFIYPLAELGLTYSSQGPLSFGFPPSVRSQIYTNYTYIAGYVNTGIATATAAATSLTVQDATGIVAGQQLNIYDGSSSERVTVATTYTFGSTTVPLTSALAYTHAAGVAISGLPPAVKEAAILVTTDFLKVRGDNSLTMAVTTRASSGPSVQDIIGSDLALAKELLRPFRKIR
jgi:hypothetical protein